MINLWIYIGSSSLQRVPLSLVSMSMVMDHIMHQSWVLALRLFGYGGVSRWS